MGWDPTISVTEVCNQDGTITRMYDIRVGDTVYKTSKILFDAPVPKTLGRATRVFEATDPQGRTCVVKDAWMREDCSMEYQIQEDMLTAVEKKFDADAVERVRRHLITVTSSWAVEVRDGVRDHTTEVMMRGGVPRILGDLYLQERSRTEPNLERWSMEHRYTISATETQCEWDMAHPVHRRIHVRNVYKELAVPMTRMPCMFIEVFPILHDIVQGAFSNTNIMSSQSCLTVFCIQLCILFIEAVGSIGISVLGTYISTLTSRPGVKRAVFWVTSSMPRLRLNLMVHRVS